MDKRSILNTPNTSTTGASSTKKRRNNEGKETSVRILVLKLSFVFRKYIERTENEYTELLINGIIYYWDTIDKSSLELYFPTLSTIERNKC